MMKHHTSVFANSCLNVPLDPITKMPKSAYERKMKCVKAEQCSIDSVSTTTCSVSTADVDAEKLKDFYRSIPDYSDINHLPTEQFYSTLKSLRHKKKIMLGLAADHIDDSSYHFKTPELVITKTNDNDQLPSAVKNKSKSNTNYMTRRRNSTDKKNIDTLDNGKINDAGKMSNYANLLPRKISGASANKSLHKSANADSIGKNNYDDSKLTTNTDQGEENPVIKNYRPKRIQSACSITWDDANIENKSEVDRKFDKFFERKKYSSLSKIDIGDDFKTQSMPSSPLRTRRTETPLGRRKSITIPKPFKMTERDEDERMVNDLRSLRKSFSEDMLHQKCERRQFRANPVPIESRIPLYDKILEDRAMRFSHTHEHPHEDLWELSSYRRAITKINSEADLRAKMKPFNFTKKEEKGLTGHCERATHVQPKTKKRKRFKARPVPKNLFSNYFYDKMKEEEFFRNMNRRIRAEEMLRNACPPGSMAVRDRSRLSTPAAHSDLPIDPSPGAQSVTSSDQRRCPSPTKEKKKRDKFLKEDFITTSPQPFHFNTADRAAKKIQDVARKMYQESKSTDSVAYTGDGGRGRVYSALDLRAAAAGRSNLAALLRAEAVRRKFNLEETLRLEEQHRRLEMRHRNRQLRSKPAWHLVKNNHEEDIAMRLQTRRDEERMRREEFLHEMELMYGRVQQQPMLFERYYTPRTQSALIDSVQLSLGKVKKRSLKNKAYHYNSPNRSRKVSINDTAEAFNGEYLNRIDNDLSDSDVGIDSDRGKL